MLLTPANSSTSNSISRIRANCLSSDLVGNAVRITGSTILGKYQVTTVDIDDPNRKNATAMGVIESKQSSTECIVHIMGLLVGSFSFTPGNRLFISPSGSISDTPPPRPFSGVRTFQQIGYVFETGDLFINPMEPRGMRPS